MNLHQAGNLFVARCVALFEIVPTSTRWLLEQPGSSVLRHIPVWQRYLAKAVVLAQELIYVLSAGASDDGKHFVPRMCVHGWPAMFASCVPPSFRLVVESV